jgi:septal ring factor EnvC (AmiA/AmiB activator)
VLGVLWQCPVLSQVDAERELEQVRVEIETVSEELASQMRSRDANVRALESIERALASTARELADLNARTRELEARGRELTAQMSAAEQRLGAEREALAEQVRMSYLTGRQELFELLLNQESPATLGRMMVYYDYLNRARSSRIEAVGAELDSLERLAEESDRVRARLETVRARTRAEHARLERQRRERAAVLTRLDDSIATGAEALESLERDEQRLAELVERLREATAAFPVDADEPFGDLEGRLTWPVPGRLASDFGEPRNGGPMRWNGVMLESPSGTLVRAVYSGRIAFSDWLPGLGLLIIVDHGGGYMSLYGHNQALFKQAGDWVAPGEPLGQVGDSGGQAAPSLYFEIRHEGDPVNPHEWVAGAPAPP